jgi:hypothetical protein
MKFWDTNEKQFNKTVLIVPNWTWFGDDKDINSDSFLLVMKSFLANNVHADYNKWIIPYPSGHLPSSLLKFDNVELVDMGHLSTFPPLMRIQFPHSFFRKMFTNYEIDIIWSHLPEWTNQLLITRRYNVMTQPVYGYCHWWEIKENGAYKWNSFVDNINGILQMEECGVNSKWVKNLIIERASEYFSQKQLDKLEQIIQPWYLGCDEHFTSDKNDVPTILFNHRDNGYTGFKFFFDLMDEFWSKGYKFKVYTTTSDIDKEYVEYVGNPDRDTYLQNISKAHIGVGAFKDYSAWSMSVTDGFSAGVPYLLPKGLCYEEMVGENYPLYNDRTELKEWLEMFLQNRLNFSYIDTQKITHKLAWKNSILGWKTHIL